MAPDVQLESFSLRSSSASARRKQAALTQRQLWATLVLNGYKLGNKRGNDPAELAQSFRSRAEIQAGPDRAGPPGPGQRLQAGAFGPETRVVIKERPIDTVKQPPKED